MSNESVSERTRQRRRILRAAASVPVVFTLPSGAAVAAGSLTCDEKSLDAFFNAQVEAFPTSPGSPDSWMRLKLTGYEIKVTNQSAWTAGFEYAGQFYQFTDDLRTKAEHVMAPSNVKLLKTQGQQVYFYGLVDYPSQNLIIDPSYVGGNGLNPIAGASCWNSLISGSLLASNVINN